MRLIEEKLKGTLKGLKTDQVEHLEEFRTQIMEYSAVCPQLETAGEKIKQEIPEAPPKDSKTKVEDVKPLYFQPSDFKREL